VEIVVGITGASGGIYGLRLIRELLVRDIEVVLLATEAGKQVLAYETGVRLGEDAAADVAGFYGLQTTGLRFAPDDDLFDPICSGSRAPDAVIIAPCSMATLAAVASGHSSGLLERAADVALKEGRKLILVPRETPLSLIHIENMARVARAGGVILPAMPAFYTGPDTVDEMVEFIVGKVLDRLGIAHDLYPRWRE